MIISNQNKEGLFRLVMCADLTFIKFGVFKKLRTHKVIKHASGQYEVHRKWVKWFYRWQKLNHKLWQIYWRLFKVKRRRIGYFSLWIKS